MCGGVWLCYLVWESSGVLSAYTHVPALLCGLVVMILTGHFVSNGRHHAFLPKGMRYGVCVALLLATVAHLHFIEHRELAALFLALMPVIGATAIRLFRRLMLKQHRYGFRSQG